jgi:hypothetical protein
MTVGGLADTVFCFNRPCECHLYTAPRNICQHLGQLSYELGKAIKRLRQKPHIIRACIAQAGLV